MKIQLAPATEVCQVRLSSSMPVIRTSDSPLSSPARSTTAPIGAPVQDAALIKPKLAGSELPEHSSRCEPVGRESRARRIQCQLLRLLSAIRDADRPWIRKLLAFGCARAHEELIGRRDRRVAGQI